MKRIGLLLMILLLGAPTAASQVPGDKLIVPGVRIGKWTLEMTIDDLVRMNGPADAIRGLSVGDVVPAAPRGEVPASRSTVTIRGARSVYGVTAAD